MWVGHRHPGPTESCVQKLETCRTYSLPMSWKMCVAAFTNSEEMAAMQNQGLHPLLHPMSWEIVGVHFWFHLCLLSSPRLDPQGREAELHKSATTPRPKRLSRQAGVGFDKRRTESRKENKSKSFRLFGFSTSRVFLCFFALFGACRVFRLFDFACAFRTFSVLSGNFLLLESLILLRFRTFLYVFG